MAIYRAKPRFPLIHQLLFSHLIVAFVGLAMLGIALVTTYDLRNRIMLLAQESGPLAQASFQLLAGVHSSLANLHGWSALGDPRFLADWRRTWREQILPALDTLDSCPRSSETACHSEQIKALQSTLANLQESQWWIQDQVRTPGNEPGRLLYFREIEPSTTKLNSLLMGLAQIEQQERQQIQLISQIDEVHQQFSTTHLLLREMLGLLGASYIPSLVNHLTTLQSAINRLHFNPLLTPEQQEIEKLLQREFKAFSEFARESIRLRQSSGWNIALQTMRQETDILSQQAISLTNEIAKQAKVRLENEILAAQTATAITVWSLILTILVMVVVAYAVSKNRADALVKPINSLLEAARQLAIGNLHTDIPIQRNDELGELTESFNSLRAAMYTTQQKLQIANVSLEQRVVQRTADLEKVNQILIQEIHIRNQTELALRDSEARLRAMTRAIPDLVFVVDEDGRYREILAAERRHPTAKATIASQDESQHLKIAPDLPYLAEIQTLPKKKSAIVGVTPIRDRFLHEVHAADKAQFFLDIIHRALATQHIQIAEYELETASGARWFESRTSPLDVKFDAKAAVIVVAHDITKRKQAEAQLRQAQKMQAIGQLTGGIAHDFNNLLAVIMGNLELLNEQLSDQPELHEFAQQALKAVDRGTYLTRRLLAFSRRQPLLAQPTDLNKLVLGMIDLMRRTLGATIQINTLLAENLDHILVDPDQLESALLNLVINARDAMPQGGSLTLQTAHILIEEEYSTSPLDIQPGPYVMLVVSDTGVGMSPKVLERAFEPFFTTKDTGKGSGFGLSIVYGLVKQSGGHITMDSQLNQGTTVRLYFPPSQKPLQSVELPTADGSCHGNGEIILVVEDDAAVRLFAINALRSLGYQTVEAADAATALQILETTPDIVLLFTDIVMPGAMDGVQLAREAQRRYPSLRVLYTSGYTEHTLIDTGHQVTGVEVLIKPYRKTDLGYKLQRLLG